MQTQLREIIVSYERSTSKWTESMVLGAGSVVDTSATMGVDRFKGKDGKGKDGFKGKGKTKGGKQQNHSQNQAWRKIECWWQGTDD